MLNPRATVIGTADASSPIYKAIKCAREPVTLDAYGMPRATVIGTANAHCPLPQYPRVAHGTCLKPSSAPTPPAERRSGQRGDRFQVFNERHAHRSPYSFIVPRRRACGRTSTSKRCSQALPVPPPPKATADKKPESPSAHTPPPIRPRLFTEPATKPGSAPGPQKECLRRQLGERGGRCRLMLFPPPWFSPLGTPLSEAPPFKRNPPGGRTHPGGHSTALFRFSVAALHRARVQHPDRNRDAGHVHGLGGRHHSAALPIPPTPQGSRAHRPFYELSPECPASCFGGQGRSATGTLAACTVADSPRNRLRRSCFEPCPPPPSRPRATPSVASSQAQKPRSELRPQGGGRKPPSSAMPPGSPSPVPLADEPAVLSAAVGIPPPSRPATRPRRPSADRRGLRRRRPRQAAFGPSESRDNPRGSGGRQGPDPAQKPEPGPLPALAMKTTREDRAQHP